MKNMKKSYMIILFQFSAKQTIKKIFIYSKHLLKSLTFIKLADSFQVNILLNIL